MKSVYALGIVLVFGTLVQAQDWARDRLAKSPRHREWVRIQRDAREVSALLVFPDKKGPTTTVIVIHENQGLTDWVQSFADQVAEAGYLVIAPDLLSGMGPEGGGTSALVGSSAMGEVFRDLPPDQITEDLNVVVDFMAKLPTSNRKVLLVGLRWGGGQTFRFATNNPGIRAAVVFYGPTPVTADGPSKDALAKIKSPVYGFYAGNDTRINASLAKTSELMKELGKYFNQVTYEGAGQGFMRTGDAPEPEPPQPKGNKEEDDKAAADYQKALVVYKANKKARDEAWVRLKKILAGM